MSQNKDRGNKQHLSITRNFDWYWMLKEMVTIRFPISKKGYILDITTVFMNIFTDNTYVYGKHQAKN